MLDAITALDFQVLNAIQLLACPFLDSLMKFVALFGTKFVLCAVLTLSVWKRTRILACLIGFAAGLELIIGGLVLKNIIARPRPFIIDPAIELLIKAPTDFSFPSGHTGATFAMACAICLADYAMKWKLLAVFVAVLVGFSRLYLRVHYPSDVLAGAVLGCVCGLAGKYLNDSFNKTKV